MRSRPATRRGMMRTGEGSEGMRGARRGLRKRPGRERVAIRPRSKPTPTAWPPGAATEALDVHELSDRTILTVERLFGKHSPSEQFF
jgi:hypothetical protein